MKQGIHGSMKYPFKEENVWVRVENHRKIQFLMKTNSFVQNGLTPHLLFIFIIMFVFYHLFKSG